VPDGRAVRREGRLVVAATTITDVVVAWPISFLLGLVCGLLLAGRGYRITRTKRNGDDR